MRLKKIALLLFLSCFSIICPGIEAQNKPFSGNYKRDISRLPLYQSQESDSLITDTLYIRKLLLRGEEEDNREAILRCMIALSVKSREEGNLKSAFYQIENIIRKAQLWGNNKMLMVAYNNYAVVCRRVDRLNDASRYHLQALKIAENFGNKPDRLILKSRCAALNGLGNISLSLKQYPDALAYFTEAIKIEQKLGSKVGMAINEANIGAVLEMIALPDSALYHYKKAMELNKQGRSAKGVAICLTSMGDILASQQKYQAAIGYFGRALQITDSIGDVYHWLSAHQAYINTLVKAGHFTEARERALKSVERARDSGIVFYLTEAYLLLSEIAEKENDPQLALHYLKLGNIYKDSIEAESNFMAIHDLKLKYETEKKEQHISWLEQQDKNHRMVRNILVLLSVLLIALVTTLWYIARFRRHSIRQKELLLLREQQLNKMAQDKLNAELEFKNQELISIANQLASKNEMLGQLRTSLEEQGFPGDILAPYNGDLSIEKDWEIFCLKFENVYPHFFKNLRDTFTDISIREERLCAYLRINMTSKEIAQILNVTVAAVDKSRNRLRKKLSLPSDKNLVEFMYEIG